MSDPRTEFERRLDALSRTDRQHGPDHGRRIDDLFTRVVPKAVRAANEQFLTPHDVATFMVEWCLDGREGSLLDPAVGTGVFPATAFERAPALDLYGYDVDPLMLQATEQRFDGDSPTLHLSESDFLGETVTRKHEYLVCNPPFKTFKEYRNADVTDWLDATYGVEMSQQANLYCAFLVHASSFLTRQGRAAFITPNEFLYANYGTAVKRFLTENYRLEALILLDSADVFDEVLTTPVITLFSNEETDGETRFLRLDEWVGASRVRELLATAPTNTVSQAALDVERNWLSYFADVTAYDSTRLVRFDAIADIKRGIATGHNDFFLCTSDDVDEWNLPRDAFARVLSKSSHCGTLVLTGADLPTLDDEGKPTYLLYHVDDVDDELRAYLDHGRALDVNERYLAANRTPWYRVERRAVAPILATTFSRDDMRFVLNDAGVRNLTAFHSIYPQSDGEDEIEALLAFLNSGVFESTMEREKRVHGGLGKFEPNDLKRLDVLDVSQLDRATVAHLATLFERLDTARRTGDDTTGVREEIDAVVTRLL